VTRLAALLALLAASAQDAAKPAAPGAAIVIGGGGDQPAIVRKFIELSGGPAARLLVLPISTSVTENPGQAMAALLRQHGAKDVGVWIPKSREEADTAESLAALRAARGLYFGGGDQKRGMGLLSGTKALGVIRERHEAGVTIAGSSAGAALMSKVMIDGAEPRGSLSPGRFATSEGLGVTGNWITDQHFLARSRMQRLINVLMDNPGYRGVGVDERTAAVIAGDTIEVVGQGQVVIIEPPAGVTSRPAAETRPIFRADEVRMRVLAPGDRFKF
jgi:cyanophycinase